MSKKNDDLVAVMLPRKTAEGCVARLPYVGTRMEQVVAEACKRALRPEPPAGWVLNRMRGRSEEICALEFIEYVLEHGWEVDND